MSNYTKKKIKEEKTSLRKRTYWRFYTASMRSVPRFAFFVANDRVVFSRWCAVKRETYYLLINEKASGENAKGSGIVGGGTCLRG